MFLNEWARYNYLDLHARIQDVNSEPITIYGELVIPMPIPTISGLYHISYEPPIKCQGSSKGEDTNLQAPRRSDSPLLSRARTGLLGILICNPGHGCDDDDECHIHII